MAATPSTMLALGTPAPDFALKDTVSGRSITLAEVSREKAATLVMFLCNHCPFVKHVRGELAKLGREYQGKGVGVVAISSNDVEKYPADSPEAMNLEAKDAGYTFPYLFDETQEVAKAYRAACTPDFYVFNRAGLLAYRGQLDDSRPKGAIPVTGADLRAALDAVIAGRPAPERQMPSLGCNIKWKAGNEPEYFKA